MPGGRLSTKPARVSTRGQILRVDDLSLGLEQRLSKTLLTPGQSSLLRNWSLREPGVLATRSGWLQFSGSTLGARRLQGGRRVYVDNAAFTVAADNGNIYRPTDAGAWGAAVLSGRDSAARTFFPHDREMVAVFNGVDAPVKSVDGLTWSAFGIAAPTVAPTASAVAGGSLVLGNTYEVSYSYQNASPFAEGNESARVSQATSAGNLTVRVQVTASADPQVTGINVYVRDVTSGESLRRLYASYANTTTTHDITSNAWASGAPAPSDHDVPLPTLRNAVVWKNRWWAVVGNRVYFTQIFERQSWPATFYIEIPFERGDEIAAHIALGDTMVVFGRASKPFLIIGQTSLDFEVRPSVGALAGALGPDAVEVLETGIVHAAAEGVYVFDGGSDRLLSYNIDPGWRDLVAGSTREDLERVAVVYHGLEKELRVAVPRLYPWSTPGEWILDLNRTRLQETPAWTQSDRSIGGYIHWNGNETADGNRGRLLSWSLTDAVLNEENIGSTANGADLVADVQLGTHATGGYKAIFAEGYLEVQPTPGAFQVTAVVDERAVSAYAVNIAGSFSTYGSATYGTAVYGSVGRVQRPWPLPLGVEGRTFAVRARYTGQQAFKWYSYAVHVVPEPALTVIG